MFRFDFDKRYLYIILGIIVVRGLINLTLEELLVIILTLPAVIVAITFHEFAHAYVADKLGDDTPRLQGRLNLNPLSHIDPIGFILLMFAGFGWGKPVQIQPKNFNRDITMDKGEMLVSIAGPAMNFIIAIVSALILGAVYMFAPTSFFYNTIGSIIYTLLQELVIINIGLGVFNLIPLPPLDGSKIFIRFFPYNARRWIMEKEQIFYIIFIIIWVTGIAGMLISPIINLLYTGLINGVLALFRMF